MFVDRLAHGAVRGCADRHDGEFRGLRLHGLVGLLGVERLARLGRSGLMRRIAGYAAGHSSGRNRVMKTGFRRSMAWLHTWSGLVVGWLLFAIFLTGTASVYRQEITQWMQPELSQITPSPNAQFIALSRLKTIAPDARRWLIDLPDERDPVAHLYIWREPGEKQTFQREMLDTSTGAPVIARSTYGGDFLYYFHFDLQMPSVWGRLIVGAGAIIMLVALVSGVITHRRIFKDFFTFRPSRNSQRSWLDAHNVVGVMALPFHLMITYTGLITLMFLYMPWGKDIVYQGDDRAFRSEMALSTVNVAASDISAPLAPLGPLLEEASRRWDGAAVGRINIHRPGNTNALIEVTASDASQIAYQRRMITFDGVTGDVIDVTDNTMWAAETKGFMYGLHMGRFADPLLRFLYFLSGMAGTAMIGTGLLLWTAKRYAKRENVQIGFGWRLVESLNIGTIVGLPIAIAGLFWANRLLPFSLAQRPDWEVGVFFAAWLLAAIHAILRPIQAAWPEQITFAALLFGALPVLNAATTDAYLDITGPTGNRALVVFDLAALAIGLLLGYLALHLHRRHRRRASFAHSGQLGAASSQVPMERR